jgi:hypothetical protein
VGPVARRIGRQHGSPGSPGRLLSITALPREARVFSVLWWGWPRRVRCALWCRCRGGGGGDGEWWAVGRGTKGTRVLDPSTGRVRRRPCPAGVPLPRPRFGVSAARATETPSRVSLLGMMCKFFKPRISHFYYCTK